MSIQTKMQAVLVAAGGITALVPTARIKPLGEQQGMTRPYIVHFPVAVNPQHAHTGLIDLTAWSFYQITVVGDSYSSADAVARAVRAVIGSYFAAGIQIMWTGTTSPIYDEAKHICEIPMDFEVWGSATD